MCCENGVLEQLRQRRSVQAFTGKPIPEETRNAILEAAAQAPTAGNQQIVSIDRYPDQTPEDRRALLSGRGKGIRSLYARLLREKIQFRLFRRNDPVGWGVFEGF